MKILNIIIVALRALRQNKMRTFLTMLGIIIGVASVIAMLAIGEGSKKSIRDEISKMGTNMLTIRPESGMRGGVRLDFSSMQSLTLSDLKLLKDSCKHISAISPQVNGNGQVIYGAFLGIMTGIFRIFGPGAEGVSYAIILGNLLVPLIEKFTMPKAFGKGGERG